MIGAIFLMWFDVLMEKRDLKSWWRILSDYGEFLLKSEWIIAELFNSWCSRWFLINFWEVWAVEDSIVWFAKCRRKYFLSTIIANLQLNNLCRVDLRNSSTRKKRAQFSTKLSLCYNFNKLLLAASLSIVLCLLQCNKNEYQFHEKRSSQDNLQSDLSLFEHLIYEILNVREV